jgi:hypothetical protein
MVDPTKNVVNEHIGSFSHADPDADSTAAKLTDFKKIQEAILKGQDLNVSLADSRQDKASGLNDTVYALLQRLQTTINDKHSGKTQEILKIKDLLAN